MFCKQSFKQPQLFPLIPSLDIDLVAGFRLGVFDPFRGVILRVFHGLNQADAMILAAANAIATRRPRLIAFRVSAADLALGIAYGNQGRQLNPASAASLSISATSSRKHFAQKLDVIDLSSRGSFSPSRLLHFAHSIIIFGNSSAEEKAEIETR